MQKGVELKTMTKFDDIGPPSDDSNYGSQITIHPTAVRVGDQNSPPPSYSGNSNLGYIPDSDRPLGPNENGLDKNQVRRRKSPIVADDGDDDQYEESSDDDDNYDNVYARQVAFFRNSMFHVVDDHNKVIFTAIGVMMVCMFLAYFIYAMVYNFVDEGAHRLLGVVALVFLFVAWHFVYTYVLREPDLSFENWERNHPRVYKYVSNITYWFAVVASVVFMVVFVIVDIALDQPENLISALGIFVFILLFYIFSYNPAKVNWRPVFWGLMLQFYFALIILRTTFGYEAFQWLGERVREFLAHTDEGSKFVFGDDYAHHFFAFKVLTVIIFFSSAVSVLYYLGAMQFIIKYIARFLAFALGTSPTESLNAAGNIFIGQTEAPLMIRPFLKDMTRSEIHAVMTGGFATIAGAVMAAYILMGVPPNHLLSASVMSAPAALAMSKLFYPETKKSKATDEVYNMKKGTDTNLLEAASKGASMSAGLIANIVVNLIAFIAGLNFINMTLIWMGHRVGMFKPELTFSLICSYLFWPVAWLLGVSNGVSNDISIVAARIGTKTFLNEFVAYAELSDYIINSHIYNTYMLNMTGTNNGTQMMDDGAVLLSGTGMVLTGVLSDRSIVIATYALCGFSNLGSMGIVLGALGAMAPTRRKDLAKVVFRAMIAGNVACFMTAAIAGLLYKT